MNERVKKVLARPDLLIMGPIVSPASGDKGPLHLASRRIYSYPDTLQVLGDELGLIVKNLGVDKIIGGETTGIILATVISMITGIPMCYVREDNPLPPRCAVEGVLNQGERVALIDDSLVTARNKLKFITSIEEAGGIVTDIVVVVNAFIPGRDQDRKIIQNKGIKVHYLCTWTDWYRILNEYGYLSDEMTKIAVDSVDNRPEWNNPNNQDKWAWFEKVKQAQKGKFI
jgi:orotate phosphoribosyltransferase